MSDTDTESRIGEYTRVLEATARKTDDISHWARMGVVADIQGHMSYLRKRVVAMTKTPPISIQSVIRTEVHITELTQLAVLVEGDMRGWRSATEKYRAQIKNQPTPHSPRQTTARDTVERQARTIFGESKYQLLWFVEVHDTTVGVYVLESLALNLVTEGGDIIRTARTHTKNPGAQYYSRVEKIVHDLVVDHYRRGRQCY